MLSWPPRRPVSQAFLRESSARQARESSTCDQCRPQSLLSESSQQTQEDRKKGTLPLSCELRPVKYLSKLIEQGPRLMKRRTTRGWASGHLKWDSEH